MNSVPLNRITCASVSASLSLSPPSRCRCRRQRHLAPHAANKPPTPTHPNNPILKKSTHDVTLFPFNEPLAPMPSNKSAHPKPLFLEYQENEKPSTPLISVISRFFPSGDRNPILTERNWVENAVSSPLGRIMDGFLSLFDSYLPNFECCFGWNEVRMAMADQAGARMRQPPGSFQHLRS